MSMEHMNPETVSLPFPDPTADETYIMWVAPQPCQVVNVRLARFGGTLPGNTTSYVAITVYDGGPVGTGTFSIASRGGKSTAWTDAKLYSPTVTARQLQKADTVALKWDETGTVSINTLVAQIDVVYGSPAAASF